jgi:hypothetical protein
MIKEDINRSVDHSDLTDEERKAKGLETEAETEARVAKTKVEKNKQPKTRAPAATPKTASKETETMAKKNGSSKKTSKASDRAPRIVLSEKQLGETRESVKLLPSVIKMAEKIQKKRKLETLSEAVEGMIVTAFGRLATLERYNTANA